MAGASRGLAEAIGRTRIAQAAFPVYANVTAAPVTQPEEIRTTLQKQLLAPVLWEQTIRAMHAAGIRQYVEAGHGRVLRGLVRGVDKEAALFGSDDPEAIEAAAAGLAGAHTG
jgi:[acyl-carrier-protein] S-malonyltransferase